MSSFISTTLLATHSYLRLFFILTVFSVLFGILTGCSSGEIKEDDPFADWTAKEFYIEAKYDLRLAEFEAAIKKLETLEARYPFSNYAKQAQLDVAYAYYKYDEPDSAISAVDRFRRLHPRSSHIDYSIYLRGLANFYRGTGIFEDTFPRNFAEHDQKNLKEAMKDFSNLIKRYPDSIYAPDAYLRIIFLRNEMAEAEIIAADYYVLREAWISAINRAQNVIKFYQTSPARNRALDIMILAYNKLGMKTLAADTQKIKDLNPAVQAVTKEQMKELKQKAN